LFDIFFSHNIIILRQSYMIKISIHWHFNARYIPSLSKSLYLRSTWYNSFSVKLAAMQSCATYVTTTVQMLYLLVVNIFAFCATDYLTPRDTTSKKYSSYIIVKIPPATVARSRVRLLIYRVVRINRPLEKCPLALAAGKRNVSLATCLLLSGPWPRISHDAAISYYITRAERRGIDK